MDFPPKNQAPSPYGHFSSPATWPWPCSKAYGSKVSGPWNLIIQQVPMFGSVICCTRTENCPDVDFSDRSLFRLLFTYCTHVPYINWWLLASWGSIYNLAWGPPFYRIAWNPQKKNTSSGSFSSGLWSQLMSLGSQDLSYHGRKENLCVIYQCILPEAFLSREKNEKIHLNTIFWLRSCKVKSITLPETARLPLEKWWLAQTIRLPSLGFWSIFKG